MESQRHIRMHQQGKFLYMITHRSCSQQLWDSSFFGQLPDMLSFVGYCVIIAAGVIMFLYNKRLEEIDEIHIMECQWIRACVKKGFLDFFQ